MPKGEGKLIAQNKKARHDYTILDTIEAGIVLQGTEIKAIRNSRINLKDGFVRIRNGEAFLVNVHISPYEQGNIFNHDPLRTRKLLLHKKADCSFDWRNKKYWYDDCAIKGIYQGWLCQSFDWFSERKTRV